MKACVFDAYGTLFDYASAAAGCGKMLGDQADRLTALWREKQLQYTWLRSVQGMHADFWQVTGEALDFALQTLGVVRKNLGRAKRRAGTCNPERSCRVRRSCPSLPTAAEPQSRSCSTWVPVVAARSHIALVAEHLFLRKQLALFQERQVRPRRAVDSTRWLMAMLSGFFPGAMLLSDATLSATGGDFRQIQCD